MKIQKCKKCGIEKTWSGDDINCPFQEISSTFTENNWNCGIIQELRSFCIDVKTNEDTNYCTIHLEGIDEEDWLCVFVSWYKNRGCTSNIIILGETQSESPSFSDLEKIVKFLKNKK